MPAEDLHDWESGDPETLASLVVNHGVDGINNDAEDMILRHLYQVFPDY